MGFWGSGWLSEGFAVFVIVRYGIYGFCMRAGFGWAGLGLAWLGLAGLDWAGLTGRKRDEMR